MTGRRRAPEPISIWEPREVDGELVFVRPDPLPLGDHYASVKVLRPKKAELPLRVVLFGESAAAGYLYAPRLTPAQVLEKQLRVKGTDALFEVVDLARTNETLVSLADTVRTSLQINPDILVVFAGNNWNLLETPEVSPYAPAVSDRRSFATALRTEGLAGPVRLAANLLRERANASLDRVALIARTVGIPVVLVLPEVNLADWSNRQPPARLPGNGTARWHSLYLDAVFSFAKKDYPACLAASRAMQQLDGGTCAATWRLLAQAFEGLGNLDEAKRSAIAEVDAASYAGMAFLGAPQATSFARTILDDAARRHGWTAVDLRQIFTEHTGESLPGRRLFLDYCHLTSEGIHLAMAAVAAQVLNLSGMLEDKEEEEKDIRWEGLLARLPAPDLSPEAEATARLGAAIHTAHRLLPVGDKGPILEYWLEAALDASPGVAEAMADFAQARCAPGPAVLTAALQRNFDSPYRLLLQHGWRWDHLDADLLEAIQAVLERRGRTVRKRIAGLLVEHHAVRVSGTDLIEPPYLWEPLERFYPEVMRFADFAERATFRSPWPESSFCLVSDGLRNVEMEATLRLPADPGCQRSGTVRFEVDGAEIGTVEAGESWSRAMVAIPRENLRPGLNRLTLRWPQLPDAGDDPLRPVRRRLEAGLTADLHPVFGELFSLIAKPAD